MTKKLSAKTKSAFPHWIYDGSPIPDPLGYGQDAVDFINALKHPKSSDPKKRFQLFDWQERIVRAIYSPVDADGDRLIREVFLFIPRGNRKTSLAAVLALLHLFGTEKVPAGEIVFAASDSQQAGIGFREAVGIVRMDRRIEAVSKIYDSPTSLKQIISKIDKSTLKAVSSDGKAQHGGTPTFVLADEIHLWGNRDLWEALQSGMGKRTGGLIITATTAGRGRDTLAAERLDYARKVATGEIDDPSFLPIIFEMEPDDDWTDETVWHRVNPGLKDGFQDIKKLRTEVREGLSNPRKAFEFQQYHLNKWHGASRDPLFDMATYDAGAQAIDFEALKSLACYIGVDMSVSGDLTAIVAAWQHDDGHITIHPWIFAPEETLLQRTQLEGLPYPVWRDEGLIHTIDAPIIEPEAIENQIRDLCRIYDVQEIAFDPSFARPSLQRLFNDGLPVVEVRQTAVGMTPHIGALERTVNSRKLRHTGHPVLRQHFDSVSVSRGDTGVIRMHKSGRNTRHDAAVASAMAVGRLLIGDSTKSFLEFMDA